MPTSLKQQLFSLFVKFELDFCCFVVVVVVVVGLWFLTNLELLFVVLLLLLLLFWKLFDPINLYDNNALNKFHRIDCIMKSFVLYTVYATVYPTVYRVMCWLTRWGLESSNVCFKEVRKRKYFFRQKSLSKRLVRK